MRQLRGCLIDYVGLATICWYDVTQQPQLNVLLRLVNLLPLNNLASTRP